MDILLLGSGAREHAIALSLAKSPSVHTIYVCPGNSGMKKISSVKRIPYTDNQRLIKTIKERVEFAVIGSSRFVERGTVDALALAGIPIIGPAEDAGKIETSKAFAYQFMAKHNIPAPKTKIALNLSEAKQIIAENPWAKVVKADGYSRGTGVAVTITAEETIDAATYFLKVHGAPIILQERIEGVECSFSILTDGNQAISFSSSREYKRAFDNDEGQTTGGMGAVSPSPNMTPEFEKQILETIVRPTVNGMHKDGLLYKGFLSIQLILTKDGPKAIEFNARLGDPETQSILARFRGDLASLLYDCSRGRLSVAGSEVAFGKHSAISIVLAREGYPENETENPAISGTENIVNSSLFFSHCEGYSPNMRFKSGRVACLTSLGNTIEEAANKCYSDIAKLSLDKIRYRKDIGTQNT